LSFEKANVEPPPMNVPDTSFGRTGRYVKMLRRHTRRVWKAACSLGLTLLLAIIEPGALQASSPTQAAAQSARDTVTNYEFDDDLIAGDTSAPSGEVLLVRRAKGTGSLVRARVSFVDQLMKSVESL
jgi:hypothetical protein